MSIPSDVEPDEGRQPSRSLVGRAMAEIREGDELRFDVLGISVVYTLDRVEFRDDGFTLHLVHAGGGKMTIEHSVIVYATPR